MAASKSLNSRRCGMCNGIIYTTAVRAINKLFHPEHFLCQLCAKPIKQNFREHEGQAFCVDCFVERFNPKCAMCTKPLVDSCITALNSKWHDECFKCNKCSKPFTGGKYYGFQGRPYCKDCHWAKKVESNMV